MNKRNLSLAAVLLCTGLLPVAAFADNAEDKARQEMIDQALRQHIGEMVTVAPNTNPKKASFNEVFFKGPPIELNGQLYRALVFTAPTNGGELVRAFLPDLALNAKSYDSDILPEQGKVRRFDKSYYYRLTLARDTPGVGAKGARVILLRYFRSELKPGQRYIMWFTYQPRRDFRSVTVSLNIFEEEGVPYREVFPSLFDPDK